MYILWNIVQCLIESRYFARIRSLRMKFAKCTNTREFVCDVNGKFHSRNVPKNRKFPKKKIKKQRFNLIFYPRNRHNRERRISDFRLYLFVRFDINILNISTSNIWKSLIFTNNNVFGILIFFFLTESYDDLLILTISRKI